MTRCHAVHVSVSFHRSAADSDFVAGILYLDDLDDVVAAVDAVAAAAAAGVEVAEVGCGISYVPTRRGRGIY